MEGMKILIVAGGQGTKLWPYSRVEKPKQFQSVIGDLSSYEQNVRTLLKQHAAEDIYVSTKRKFIKYVSEQSPQIPLKNYIIEPDEAKDRGPGEGLAFLRLSLLYPDEPFFLVQSDLIRLPEEAFLETIRTAEQIVKKHKRYITGGIKATTPSLSADYLQLGERVSKDPIESYTIDHFHYRKTSLRETRELIENYHVVAHWNHLCWYPTMMLDAYKKYRPDWYDALMKIRDVIDKPGENEAIEKVYATMEKGPTEEVTKHIMESGEAIAMLLPFKLTDIGTWGDLYDFFEDGISNYEDGKVVAIDTKGSLIKASDKNKLIAVAGMRDMIIVDTPDALLIVPKAEVHKIKEIQAALKERKETQYL